MKPKTVFNLERRASLCLREPSMGEPANRPILEVKIQQATEIIPLTPEQAQELGEYLIELAAQFRQ